MKVGVFSTQPYDREPLNTANQRGGHELVFSEARLDRDTADWASGFDAVVVTSAFPAGGQPPASRCTDSAKASPRAP